MKESERSAGGISLPYKKEYTNNQLIKVKYIIQIEIEEKGFIFTSKLLKEEAFEYVELIFFKTFEYNINKLELLEKINLEHKYLVKNESIHHKKCLRSITNGFGTVVFIQVSENFNLESYIKIDDYSIPIEENYEEDIDLSEIYPEFSENLLQNNSIKKETINFDQFRITWKEELEKLGQLLDELTQYQEILNEIDLTDILKTEELITYQKNWIQLQSKYKDVEKDFFKPYWVPIQSSVHNYFIDISNPEFPIISSVYIFSEVNKYIGFYVYKSVKELIQQCKLNYNFSIIANNLKNREIELFIKYNRGGDVILK